MKNKITILSALVVIAGMTALAANPTLPNKLGKTAISTKGTSTEHKCPAGNQIILIADTGVSHAGWTGIKSGEWLLSADAKPTATFAQGKLTCRYMSGPRTHNPSIEKRDLTASEPCPSNGIALVITSRTSEAGWEGKKAGEWAATFDPHNSSYFNGRQFCRYKATISNAVLSVEKAISGTCSINSTGDGVNCLKNSE